ncbi:unnamed protein product [Closterium sp. NIES-53]
MASLCVLAFDHEGRPIQFDTWLDDLQLYLLSDSRDTISLFDHTSGASLAPPAIANSATRSQWLTHDAAACLTIRNHLPLAECAHYEQHRTAQSLYDAVVARYSSPATAALVCLLLPYLFHELSAFATVEDLVTHICTSDARYRATADDYTCYTTVFHLHSKGEVPGVLIPWICAVRLQLRERFRPDLPVLCLHSDRGGEFSSDLLRDFCRGEGILQSFTLPASPQQNRIAEHRIGLVMEVTRTSMIHAATPHFLWPFAVRYGAHQLNLWPRVSLPETSPTLRWTGEVDDASVFQLWGSCAFVRDTSADKLSARAIPCVFLGFPPDAPSWQFYHPTLRGVFPSHDVTFDESVPFYRLFTYRAAPPPPPPLFLAPGPPPVDPLPFKGPAPLGVSQVDPLPGTVPVEVAVDSGAASKGVASGGAEPACAESEGAGSGGAEPGGAEPGVAEPAGVEPRGAEPEGVEPGGAESEGAESGGAEPWESQPLRPLGYKGLLISGANLLTRLSPRPEPLSPQQLRDWFAQSTHLRSGAAGAGDSAAGDTGAGGVGAIRLGGSRVSAGAGGTGGAVAPGPGGARTSTGAGGSGAGGAGTRDTRAVDPRVGGVGAGCAVSGGTIGGGTVSPRPFFVPLLRQTYYFTEGREPESRRASPVRAVCTGRRVSRPRPPPVPGTHAMAIRPSSVPLRVPLPPPPESSLSAVPDPESDLARATNPTVSHLLATIVTDPSFESTAASALVADLSESASPPSVEGECALGMDVFEDRQEDFECLEAAVPHLVAMLLAREGDPDAPDIPTPRSYAEAITGPYSSQWQTAMDAEMVSWKSICTYVNAVPPSGPNIVDGMWIFRVKRPPGSPPAFKACYVARGFNQRQGVNYFQTFSPAPKMTTLWVLLHVAAQCDYELHSLDFSIDFLQGSLHEEIWVRRPLGFTGSFPAGTQWSLRRPVYGLRQAPREWHVTMRTTLAALEFTPSTADPLLFLRTNTSLPPFFVLVYVNDLVFATADTEALTLVKSELQKRHTCTDLGELRSYLGLQITRDRARRMITLTQSHMVHQVLQRFGFQFSSPQPTPLSTGHSLSAPPSDESVELSGPYPELVGCVIARGPCRSPCRPDHAVSSPRHCSPRRMPPPPSLPCAVSSPHGLACTVASPAHTRHAARASARQVSQRLPDELHPRPPGQPSASPPRPTCHAPAFYPSPPPDGPTVAAAFAPALWGEGGELGVVTPCCAAALTAARSCSPGGLPPHAPASAVPLPLPPHTLASTASLAEGLVKLNLLPLHRLSLLLSAVAVFSALGVPLQEDLLARYVAPGRHQKVHWDATKRVLRYLCSTSGMGLMLGGRGPVVLTGQADASWVDDLATQRSSQGYTSSLGSGSISWQSTRSSSVLSSSCEAKIYAGAMAAQEFCWLTYMLIDLGEQPRSPPVLYVDNKAMIALCQEHRLEHRTKHITLRYFLARKLQQRGQLRLAYVATRANTADISTKALQPGDHQRFSTVLGSCAYSASLAYCVTLLVL